MTMAMLLQDTRDDALKEGMEKGKKEEILRSVKNIMEGFRVSLEQAMTVQKLSAEEQEYCRKMLNSSAG